MAGVGQAQLVLLEGLVRGTVKAAEPVLITSSALYPWPAMLPGWLAGRVEAADLTIDLKPLAARAGCRLVEGEVRRVDAAARLVLLSDGRSEPYEVLSLSAEPEPKHLDVSGARGTGLPAYPALRLRDVLPAIDRVRGALGTRDVRVVVVGSGPTGFEIACALRARLTRDAIPAIVTLVDAGADVLRDRSPSTRAAAARLLQRVGIGTALGAVVTDVSSRGLRIASGALIPADAVIWAAGAMPSALIASSGLELDEWGNALVDDTLRSVSHPEVLVSDANASRQDRVLRRNIAALCGDGSARLSHYSPPRETLCLLDCGDGTGLFSYGSVATEGRWVMALKERIDQRFITRFQPSAAAT
jgi:NADH dehydrogenase FAD-containing subunit